MCPAAKTQTHGQSGFGSRCVSAPCSSPASGSAEQHLPFPHKSAPLYCSISPGDTRRLKAQLRTQASSTSRFSLEQTETTCSVTPSLPLDFPARCLCLVEVSASFAGTASVCGNMRVTVGSRGWWCPTMNAGWLFMFSAQAIEFSNKL